MFYKENDINSNIIILNVMNLILYWNIMYLRHKLHVQNISILQRALF